MSLKAASIYQKSEGFILQADAPSGKAWLASTPVLKLPNPVSSEELGRLLLFVLEQEQPEAAWPTDWKESGKKHLLLLGMKSTKQLHTGCKFCHVVFDGNTFQFEPSENQKTSFAFFANQTIIVNDKRPTAIGAGALQALAASK